MKKFWNSKWTFALVPVFVSFILSLLADWIKKVELFSTLKAVLKILMNWLIIFLNFEVKIWLIFVALGVLTIVLWIIIKITNMKESSKPEFLQYNEDQFKDWKWSWSWSRDYSGRWQVEGLIAHCPRCDTPMRHDNYDTVFRCSRCDYESRHHSDNHDDIMVVIYDNVERRVKRSQKS